MRAGQGDHAARAGILELLARYGRCADRDSPDASWAECFTEDAVLRSFSPRPDRPPSVIVGSAAIDSAFATIPEGPATCHVTANVVIQHDGGEARVSSAFVRLDRVADSVLVGSFGRYQDRVVLCGDGLWRLAAREIHLMSRRR